MVNTLSNKNKKAFVTGISGQDGHYLTKLLLNKNYEVHGMIRCSTNGHSYEIEKIRKFAEKTNGILTLHFGELTDEKRIQYLINTIQPDEVYNLGAQSHVKTSFECPDYTFDVVANGAKRLLDSIRIYSPHSKYYQASTSEMFGNSNVSPQNELTPFNPCSPYAEAKVFAHNYTLKMRDEQGLFACSGILFNHESPCRRQMFVTRKVTTGIAKILLGKQEHIYLGNLEAKRDFGYAEDYVRGMWLMMQHDIPDVFVLASGESFSIREFVQQCCSYANLDFEKIIRIDEKYYRPSEVNHLLGDYRKAKDKLGWEPLTKLPDLVKIMIDSDLELSRHTNE